METPSLTAPNIDVPASEVRPSPFLYTGSFTAAGTLAILHLKRDHSIPTILAEHDDNNEGYDEGKVTNTRFGSFPHSTLIGLPWGSQVRASNVDTGSRGRKITGQKRKREGAVSSNTSTPVPGETDTSPAEPITLKTASAADSGYIHVLPPTPEVWTMSLPHRTQVVYTPDYSLVLQKLRALPGAQLIEAGAGSGSFSHAAARAIFSGYPNDSGRRRGKVWSFEFHKTRCEKLQKEIRDHGLSGVVEVNHRDVCENGFSVRAVDGQQLIQATSVFLDLPAPWLALPSLVRKLPATESNNEVRRHGNGTGEATIGDSQDEPHRTGPLNTKLPVHICCFLPCIEQVQRTVTTLKSLGWQEVSVVEVAAKRLEIRRERVGIMEEGLRGVNASPANVDEALLKLREAEERTRAFHLANGASKPKASKDKATGDQVESGNETKPAMKSKQARLKEIKEDSERRKLYKEGKLIHRAEAELKTHTSYLIFAVLPREWNEEDELAASKRLNSTEREVISGT